MPYYTPATYRDYLRRELLAYAIRTLQPGESMELASGEIIHYPNYYADLRRLAGRPMALVIAVGQIQKLLPHGFTVYSYIGAVPTGALVALGAVSYRIGLDALKRQNSCPMTFYVRAEAKGHGPGQQIEGYLSSEGDALMIEDVVRTGGSLVAAIQTARSTKGARISEALCILDREEGGKEALAAIGVELISVFTASELGLKQA